MSAPKPRMLFDCDGIFRNFIFGVLREVNALECTNYQHDDVTQWDIAASLGYVSEHTMSRAYHEVSKAAGVRSLPVYDGAIEAYAKLTELIDPYWVTAPMAAPHWTYETERWLNRHFGVHHRHVVHTSAKHTVAGHILLEDKLSNLEAWTAHNPDGYGLLWTNNTNRHEVWEGLRPDSWDLLVRMVDKIVLEIDVRSPMRWLAAPVAREPRKPRG